MPIDLWFNPKWWLSLSVVAFGLFVVVGTVDFTTPYPRDGGPLFAWSGVAIVLFGIALCLARVRRPFS